MTSYFDIYLNQLFSVLGQLTAVLVSSTVIIPVYGYYSRQFVRNGFNDLIKEHKKHLNSN